MSIINRYVIFAAAAFQGGLGLELQGSSETKQKMNKMISFCQNKVAAAPQLKNKVKYSHMM